PGRLTFFTIWEMKLSALGMAGRRYLRRRIRQRNRHGANGNLSARGVGKLALANLMANNSKYSPVLALPARISVAVARSMNRHRFPVEVTSLATERSCANVPFAPSIACR